MMHAMPGAMIYSMSLLANDIKGCQAASPSLSAILFFFLLSSFFFLLSSFFFNCFATVMPLPDHSFEEPHSRLFCPGTC